MNGRPPPLGPRVRPEAGGGARPGRLRVRPPDARALAGPRRRPARGGVSDRPVGAPA